MARRVDDYKECLSELIEIKYHNGSFVHLVMQKQSGNGVKGS